MSYQRVSPVTKKYYLNTRATAKAHVHEEISLLITASEKKQLDEQFKIGNNNSKTKEWTTSSKYTPLKCVNTDDNFSER